MKKIRNIFHGILFIVAVIAYFVIINETKYVDTTVRFMVSLLFEFLDTTDPLFKMWVYAIGIPGMFVIYLAPLLLCLLVIFSLVEITTTSEERRRARGAEKIVLLRVKNQRRKELLPTAKLDVLPLRITPTPTLNQIRRSVDERGNRRH